MTKVTVPVGEHKAGRTCRRIMSHHVIQIQRPTDATTSSIAHGLILEAADIDYIGHLTDGRTAQVPPCSRLERPNRVDGAVPTDLAGRQRPVVAIRYRGLPWIGDEGATTFSC